MILPPLNTDCTSGPDTIPPGISPLADHFVSALPMLRPFPRSASSRENGNASINVPQKRNGNGAFQLHFIFSFGILSIK
jgi:hypothetical protein